MNGPDLTRRGVLKGTGVAGITAIGGFAAFGLGAPTATASTSTTIGNASVTSNAGRVKNVRVDTTGRLTFDGLERAATKFRIRVYLSATDGGGNTVVSETKIHDTSRTDFPASPGDWGGSGEAAEGGREGYVASDASWYVVQQDGAAPDKNGYPLPSNPVDNDPFTVDTDGSSKTYTIEIRSRYDLYNSNGSAITGSGSNVGVVETTGTVTLDVTNQSATTSFGDNDAQGQGGDSATANEPSQD